MSQIEVDGLRKEYADVVAVDDMSFELSKGDLLTLLGPSGCGKTTTLDMIAGLITPDRGDIYVEGEQITSLNPENRPTVKVFQEYALFPHMTVGENVAFGLSMDGIDRSERKRRVSETLEIVQLGNLADRSIGELSGGQRQRVATARALIKEPSVLLLDEPFSSLDLKLREQLQIELRELQQELNITTIHVTHDQEEAMILSDKMVVMNQGKKRQEGSPSQIYDHPESEFIADFIGKSNLLVGTIIESKNNYYIIETATGGKLKGVTADESASYGKGEQVTCCIRPEKCRLSATDDKSTQNHINATVEHRFPLGSLSQYRLSVSDGLLQNDSEFVVEEINQNAVSFDQSQTVSIGCDGENIKIIGEA